jgi:uncharacterized protein YndB with AHSA1/START domain
MTQQATLDLYGVLTEPATLKIERRLPGPIERVWKYLTDSDLRRQWLAAGEMELAVGAPFEFVWRNDELTDPPGQRPPGAADEHRLQCQITDLDPPRKLAFTWGRSGGVSIQLTELGDQVLLTLVHRRLSDRDSLLNVSAGWHMHLDLLVAKVTGASTEPFWDGCSRLRSDYDRRIPA